MTRMTPLKNSSRKRSIRKALLHERVRTNIPMFLCLGFFCPPSAAVTPVTTSAEAETMATTPKKMGHATGHLGKKHLGHRNDGINYFGFNETPPPGYFGNWGYNPGGEYWNPND